MTNQSRPDEIPISDLCDKLKNLETSDDEIDILIWLKVGERLGVPQTDSSQRNLVADRTHRHFVPSATWNGRDLRAALEWCRDHNRNEIARVAHDWGVPRFTGSLDAARKLVRDDMVITRMREADSGTPAHARIQTRQSAVQRPDDAVFDRNEASGNTLPATICRTALELEFGKD